MRPLESTIEDEAVVLFLKHVDRVSDRFESKDSLRDITQRSQKPGCLWRPVAQGSDVISNESFIYYLPWNSNVSAEL